jgi:hypothetical protein
MWARIHLTPLLQAEEDRDMVRKYWADQEREKQLLGTNTQVYHSDRYMISRTDKPYIGLTYEQICETDICGDARERHEIMSKSNY